MKLLTSIHHQQQVIVQQFDNAPSTLFKSYIPILKLHLLNISSLVMESPTHLSGIGSFEQFVYKTCQKLFDVMKYTPTCSMCFHIECYYQLNHRLNPICPKERIPSETIQLDSNHSFIEYRFIEKIRLIRTIRSRIENRKAHCRCLGK